MARRARVTIPSVPHHVTQRGNRRERIFFEPGDEALYLDLMSAQLRRHGVACWAYCLMPNHLHLIRKRCAATLRGGGRVQAMGAGRHSQGVSWLISLCG